VLVLGSLVMVHTHKPPCKQLLVGVAAGGKLSLGGGGGGGGPVMVMWLLAPTIHPMSSGLQQWGGCFPGCIELWLLMGCGGSGRLEVIWCIYGVGGAYLVGTPLHGPPGTSLGFSQPQMSPSHPI